MTVKAKEIISTIITGAIVILGFVLCIKFINTDIIQESVEEASSSPLATIFVGGLVGFGMFLLCGMICIIGVIGIIISLHNFKKNYLIVRVINYIFTGMSLFTVIATIVKMILLKNGN